MSRPKVSPRPVRVSSASTQHGFGMMAGLLLLALILFAALVFLAADGLYFSRDRTDSQASQSPAQSAPNAKIHPPGHTAANAPIQQSPLAGLDGGTEYSGRVIRVGDGDGVEFQTAKGVLKIRLDSVDAPEVGDGKKRPGQPFARQSREHLEQWLASRTITARCFEQDQYGRSVCALIDQNGASAGRAQVAAGYAWAYTAARGKYLRDPEVVALQDAAQRAKVGLWQQANPNRPWQWRYDCWQKRQC